MNELFLQQLIQNVLYAGHCIGVCSDWSEKTSKEISEMLKDKDYSYNENISNYTQLKDEYEALHMTYLSQVSLYKSLYEEEKKKHSIQDFTDFELLKEYKRRYTEDVPNFNYGK